MTSSSEVIDTRQRDDLATRESCRGAGYTVNCCCESILHRENGSDHLSDGAADGEEIGDTLLSPTAEGVQWSGPETAEIGIEEDGNERDVP